MYLDNGIRIQNVDLSSNSRRTETPASWSGQNTPMVSIGSMWDAIIIIRSLVAFFSTAIPNNHKSHIICKGQRSIQRVISPSSMLHHMAEEASQPARFSMLSQSATRVQRQGLCFSFQSIWNTLEMKRRHRQRVSIKKEILRLRLLQSADVKGLRLGRPKETNDGDENLYSAEGQGTRHHCSPVFIPIMTLRSPGDSYSSRIRWIDKTKMKTGPGKTHPEYSYEKWLRGGWRSRRSRELNHVQVGPINR